MTRKNNNDTQRWNRIYKNDWEIEKCASILWIQYRFNKKFMFLHFKCVSLRAQGCFPYFQNKTSVYPHIYLLHVFSAIPF